MASDSPFNSPNLRLKSFEVLASESLEDRCLLSANIKLDPATSVVTIFGSSLGDLATVDIVVPSTVRVALNTSEIEQVLLSTVARVDFIGRAGDDVFINRTSISSRANGEDGNDRLTGGYGTNVLSGGNGNDSLVGRTAVDCLYGGFGNDQLWGGPGADQLNGDDGDDVIYGQEGDDFLYGHAGNDSLMGESGRDSVRGLDGNDRIFGGEQDDFLYGENGIDTIYGEAGNDTISGGYHNDVLVGGMGDDKVYGDYGDDQLFGSVGNDLLEGFYGADALYGEEGVDLLRGQGDADLLRGGAGNDTLYGDDGNDRLYGEIDADTLVGGNGDDRLYGGGVSVADRLYGSAGRDRFLLEGPDVIADWNSIDAKLIFSPGNIQWTAAETEIIDEGFQKLYEQTRNNVLLRDTLDPTGLRFVKYTALSGGALSINRLNTRTTSAGTTYTRTIEVADWNETNPQYNQMLISTVVHEVGHCWDSQKEIAAVRPVVQGLWGTFLARSGWTQSQPPNLTLYNRSADGKWWYLKTAEFARSYGRHNPYEDWSTVWEHSVFLPNQPVGTNLLSKINTIRALFAELAKMP